METTQITGILAFSVHEELKPLMAAYIKARLEMEPLICDKMAKISGTKGTFTYPYASLARIQTTINKAILPNGLAYVQNPSVRYDGQRPFIHIEHYIFHAETGSMLHFAPYEVQSQGSDGQAIASATTYAKRYCWMNVFGIDDQRYDDDGNSGTGQQAEISEASYQDNRPQQSGYSRAPSPAGGQQGQRKAAPQAQNGGGQQGQHTTPTVVAQTAESSVSDEAGATGNHWDQVIEVGGVALDLAPIYHMGETHYNAENWPGTFVRAIASWEHSQFKARSRPILGDIAQFSEQDLFSFYTGLHTGLTEVIAKKAAKDAEIAAQTAEAVR